MNEGRLSEESMHGRHWIQNDASRQVNDLLREFLTEKA